MNQILIEEARKFLNVRESSVNNIAPAIQEMQKSTWLKPAAWAWCAAFTCHVLKKSLEREDFAEYILSRYNVVGSLENWMCKDAIAFGWITWANKLKLTAKHKDLILFDESKTAKCGDIVVFDFSHIGFVTNQVPNSGIISTIEGNTSPKTTQRDGVNDGVYEMTRKDTLVKSYIRL